MTEKRVAIWTIGHSTLSIAEFVRTLKSFAIEIVVDVRSFPGSRRYPHFNRETLSVSLTEAGIEYLHHPSLGGRRRARADSQNLAWRNESFRGYADHMKTPDFRKGIARLLDLASARRTAILCSEAVWWRCHRGLVSDYLKGKRVELTHIA